MNIRIEITKRPIVHPEALTQLVRAAFAESLPQMERAVREGAPRGVGGDSGLAGSIFSELTERPAFMQSLTSSPLPYAAPVEFGRSAGTTPPPVSALIPWVERFIALKAGETAKGVAFAIARYMGQRGSRSWRQSPPGVRMFERGAERAAPLVERIFADHLKTGAVRLITS